MGKRRKRGKRQHLKRNPPAVIPPDCLCPADFHALASGCKSPCGCFASSFSGFPRSPVGNFCGCGVPASAGRDRNFLQPHGRRGRIHGFLQHIHLYRGGPPFLFCHRSFLWGVSWPGPSVCSCWAGGAASQAAANASGESNPISLYSR